VGTICKVPAPCGCQLAGGSLVIKVRLVVAALTFGLISASSLGLLPDSQISSARAAAGGPIILDGTDSSLHGSVDEFGNPQTSWLYMQKAIEALYAALPTGYAATDNGKIAVIGAEDSTYTLFNCGGAAHAIGAKLAKTVDYYKGAAAIAALLVELEAGTNKYSVVWVVEQNWGANCLDNGGDRSESDALLANAAAIAAHVNRGGAFFQQAANGYLYPSSESSYRWLTALFPTIQVNYGWGSNPDFTTEGSALFGGISSSNVHNPWHSYFTDSTGTLPLTILAYQAPEVGCVDTGPYSCPKEGAVIIGGASVTLPSEVAIDLASFAEVGTQVCATVTVTEPIEGTLTPKSGAAVTWAVTGAHTSSGSGTTGADGTATYCYRGTTIGTDTVTVTYGEDSADSSIEWRRTELPPTDRADGTPVHVLVLFAALACVAGVALRRTKRSQN